MLVRNVTEQKVNKMKITEIKAYKTEDGRIFEDREKAIYNSKINDFCNWAKENTPPNEDVLYLGIWLWEKREVITRFLSDKYSTLFD